jgi:hypothetical protein
LIFLVCFVLFLFLLSSSLLLLPLSFLIPHYPSPPLLVFFVSEMSCKCVTTQNVELTATDIVTTQRRFLQPGFMRGMVFAPETIFLRKHLHVYSFLFIAWNNLFEFPLYSGHYCS